MGSEKVEDVDRRGERDRRVYTTNARGERGREGDGR